MQNAPHALFGQTPKQLETRVAGLDLPRHTARQLADWLYKKDVTRIEEMTNLSLATRATLDAHCTVGLSRPVSVQTSADGTRKYMFSTGGGQFIETVYIPENNRHTLCISSQAGCKMGCLFCMTGRQGFQGQLSAGDILNQIRSLPERHLLTNLVYMGMGEPFDNTAAVMDSLEILTAHDGFAIAPRRITVSTAGIIPGMKLFLEKTRCPLAISLHSPFADERRRLMPVEQAYPLHEVLDTLRTVPMSTHRRIYFEYIVFKDMNHSPRHVNELARILNGIRCRINLLRCHPLPDIPLTSPDDPTLIAFRDALNAKGIIATIRRSRGLDIAAACGLLSTQTGQA